MGSHEQGQPPPSTGSPLSRLPEEVFSVFAAMGSGVTISSTSGGLLFVNDTAAQLMGFSSAEEALATPVAEVVRRHQLLDEDGAVIPYDKLPTRDALKGLRPPPVEIRFRVVATGEERWSLVTSTPLFDTAGAVAWVVNVFYDITPQKQAQQLQRRLARYEALRADVASAMAGMEELSSMLQRCCEALVKHLGFPYARIWLLDEERQVLRLRASAGRDSSLEGPLAVLKVGQYRIGKIAEEKRLYQTNDAAHDPLIALPDRLREEGVVALAGAPLLMGDRLVGVVTVLSTHVLPEDTGTALVGLSDTIAHGVERRRAELALAVRAGELERSNAELERFAYVASHDLQEPLRMVASYTQLLARRYRGKLDSDADEFIRFAVDGANRMQSLISDLLAYSRVSTYGRPMGPTESARAVEQALAKLWRELEQNEARVTADDLPTVVGDPVQLEQLFTHLLSNAIKYRRPEPPRVHIAAQPRGGEWLFRVQDNGIGIEPQYFDRIFVIFQRLHSSAEYPGTGVGLAICRRIVERHGGRMWVESTLGSGSSFLFTLPAHGTDVSRPLRIE